MNQKENTAVVLEAEEEEDIEVTASSAADVKFDQIVGALEDIIMEDEFVKMLDTFAKQHCKVFDNTETNKLEYTAIHEQYVSTVEAFIEKSLHQKVKQFDMVEFLQSLQERENQIDGDVFDMLMTFTEFAEFKSWMLEQKAKFFGNKKKHAALDDLLVITSQKKKK